MTDWDHTRLRKKGFSQRIAQLRKWKLIPSPTEPFLLPSDTVTGFADSMIETAVGVLPLPLGLAENFLIDGRHIRIPMATEEPSVIAAATFMAGLIAHHGGFRTEADSPVVIGQTIIINPGPEAISLLQAQESALIKAVNQQFPAMQDRGGGAKKFCFRMVDPHSVSCDLYVDVRDAMGANTITRMLEHINPQLVRIVGGKKLLTVVSNHCAHRLYTARCRIPIQTLRRGGYGGEEVADRLVHAGQIAFHDPLRAVTHNKGIMNGVHALALATGNDTRAVESGVHAYATRDGQYRGLGEYIRKDDVFQASLQLPLILATTGGGTMHPVASLSFDILARGWEQITASRLGRTAVALGLAQNLAALLALTTEGILAGHMKQHERRIVWLKAQKKAG